MKRPLQPIQAMHPLQAMPEIPRGGRRAHPLSLAALLIALSPPLLAQGQTPAGPDAGSILQQMPPIRPSIPPRSGTGLRIEQDSSAQLPAGVPFEVTALRISGNTVFDTATLHGLVADAEGQRLTLTQLLEVVARITDHYRSHGYPLSRAVLRAQVVRNGVVSLDVLEARYGTIEFDNRSTVDDTLLRATLAPLQAGQLVSQAALDRALLLLSDIPGLTLDATLKPGQTVGSSDLQVDTGPGTAVAGNVAGDNYGSAYTGRARVSAIVDLLNPLRHGDALTASLLSSGRGLAYGRLAYESLLDGAGTRVGGAYSLLRYRLDGSLEPLAVHGSAGVASLWARTPLVRTRDANLSLQLRLERMQLRDRIDSSALRTDRDLDAAALSLAGDLRDGLLYGGFNTWTAGWTGGRVSFQDDSAKAADASTAGTQGGFSRWHGSFARLQALSPADTVYLSVSGQWSAGNLDSAQKMSVGGPSSVRAYEPGTLSGDTGVLATAELRHELASELGRWQLVAFVDSARLRLNASPWGRGRDNRATLSGAGVGLNWSGPGRWQLQASVATAIGSRPEQADGTAFTRAWVEVRKSF